MAEAYYCIWLEIFQKRILSFYNGKLIETESYTAPVDVVTKTKKRRKIPNQIGLTYNDRTIFVQSKKVTSFDLCLCFDLN